MAELEALHAPIIPILRHALASAALPRAGLALDLACGGGLKTALLTEACGPGVHLVGIDKDRLAIGAARQLDHGAPASWIAGDVLALPLRDGSCDMAFCIAALGLFGDPAAALRELRRVLAPGGGALVLTATQAWAPVTRWPARLGGRLRSLYARALCEGHPPLAANPDLGGDMAEQFGAAGFATAHIGAFLLDSAPHPLDAELPLLSWPSLRPLLVAHLAPAELATCDQVAATADVELCTIALVGLARVGQ